MSPRLLSKTTYTFYSHGLALASASQVISETCMSCTPQSFISIRRGNKTHLINAFVTFQDDFIH